MLPLYGEIDVDAAHDVLHDGFIKIFTTSPSGECIEYLGDKGMVTQAIDYLRNRQQPTGE